MKALSIAIWLAVSPFILAAVAGVMIAITWESCCKTTELINSNPIIKRK